MVNRSFELGFGMLTGILSKVSFYTSKINFLSNPRRVSIILGVMTFLFTFYNTFFLTEYENYLASDMQAYYQKALDRAHGNDKAYTQWCCNSSFYHFYLAEVIKVVDFAFRGKGYLNAILFINAILAGFAAAYLYRIGLLLFVNTFWALALTLVYGMGYPSMHYAVFVMGESTGVPLIIISLYYLFRYSQSWKVLIGALLFCLGAAMRPSNAPLALAYCLFILLSHFSWKWKILLRKIALCAGFTMVFAAIFGWTSYEMYRISDGQTASISPHSGFNYFMGVSGAQAINTHDITDDGGQWFFNYGSGSRELQRGTIKTELGIYKSDKYKELAADYFDYSWRLVKPLVVEYKLLISGNVFPTWYSQKLAFLFDYYKILYLIMTFSLGLLVWVYQTRVVPRKYLAFFSTVLALSLIGVFPFPKKIQYFQNFSYALYFLFFFILYTAYRQKWKSVLFWLGGYAIIIGLGVLSVRQMNEHNKENPSILTTYRSMMETRATQLPVDKLDFKLGPKLVHESFGDMDHDGDQISLQFSTLMHVNQSGWYHFLVYSEGSHSLKITRTDKSLSNQVVFTHSKGGSVFRSNIGFHPVYLDQGTYLFEGDYTSYSWKGLVIYYFNPDADFRKHPSWVDAGFTDDNDFINNKKAPKHVLGENTADITFSLPVR